MRVRARYAKTGKVRFCSAIDLGRLWERALRRAGLPIAYSEGFSPHPKVSFPDALPLGYASTGEYVELTFARVLDLEDVVARLDAALPDGLEILDGCVVADGERKFAALLRASVWDVTVDGAHDAVAEACAAALAADVLPVGRERKGEVRTLDLRPAVAALAATRAGYRVVLHHVEPAVRPTEVHAALRTFCSLLPEPALTTRVAQGTPTDDGLLEALSGALVAPPDGGALARAGAVATEPAADTAPGSERKTHDRHRRTHAP